MTTANDVVTGAAKKINVIAAGETLSGQDAADGLQNLNDMLHAFELQGIFLGHTDLALAGTINLPDSHIEGLKAILAVRMAPEYEKEASMRVQMLASDTESLFITHYAEIPVMSIDSGLTRMPSQYMGRRR